MAGNPRQPASQDVEAMNALAAAGMGTSMESLAALVGGNEAVDEDEEEREFQRLMAAKGKDAAATVAVVGDDDDGTLMEDILESDDDDGGDGDDPYRRQQQQQQQQYHQSDKAAHRGPVFKIEPRHVAARDKNGTALLRFTELFGPLAYKPVGVDPFVEAQTHDEHRGRARSRRRSRKQRNKNTVQDEIRSQLSAADVWGVTRGIKSHFGEKEKIGHDDDEDDDDEEEFEIDLDDTAERIFARQRIVIPYHEIRWLQEAVHDIRGKVVEYLPSGLRDEMLRIPQDEIEKAKEVIEPAVDVDEQTNEASDTVHEEEQKKEALTARTDKPLLEQNAWEECIIWEKAEDNGRPPLSSHAPPPRPHVALDQPSALPHLPAQAQESRVPPVAGISQPNVPSRSMHIGGPSSTPALSRQERASTTATLVSTQSDEAHERWGTSDPHPDAALQTKYDKLISRQDVGTEELERILQLRIEAPESETTDTVPTVDGGRADAAEDDSGASEMEESEDDESGEIPTKKKKKDKKDKVPSTSPKDSAPKESFYQRKMRRQRMKLMKAAQHEQEELGRRRPKMELDFLREWKAKEEDQPLRKGPHVRGPIANEHMEQSKWLESIIWDTEELPRELPDSNLIIDPRDKYMMLAPVVTRDKRLALEQARMKREMETNPLFRGELHPNPYNLSNDYSYEDVGMSIVGAAAEQQKRTLIVSHSTPAQELDPEYYLLHIPNSEIRRLHRPRYSFSSGSVCTIHRKLQRQAKTRVRAREMDKKKSLSAFNHHVILVEHAEQMPAVLCNRGMGANVVNYYQRTGEEKYLPRPKDGRTVLVQSQDEVPVMGMMEKGQFFTTLENTLYSAQIHHHETPSTDFLLCTRKKPSGVKFYIREIPSLYSAGHTQPRVEVPQLGSRMHNNFIRNRISQYIFRAFLREKAAGRPMTTSWGELKTVFESMPDTSLRKALKELATFKRHTGFWVPKEGVELPKEHELKSLVTPEMICMHESMLYGNLRLEERHVDPTVSMAAYILSSYDLGEREWLKRTIRFVERERNLTPWSKCINLSRAIDVKEGADIGLLEIAVQNLNRQRLDYLNRVIEDAITEFVDRALADEAEQGDALANMSNEQAKRILLERGGFSETFTNRMTLADRKLMAIKVMRGEITSEEDAGQQLSARELVRRSKFREVLRFVFAIEADKLKAGLPYYGKASVKTAAPTTETTLSEFATTQRKPEDMQDVDEDQLMDRMLEEMLTAEEEGDFSMEQGEEENQAELDRILEGDGLRQTESPLAASQADKVRSRTLQESESLQAFADMDQAPIIAFEMAATPKSDKDESSTREAENEGTEEKPRRRLAVRRTVRLKMPDGSVEKKVEIIRDPELVQFYVRRKRAEEAGEPIRKRGKLLLQSDSDERFRAAMKERRKLQDLFRRWKRNRSEEYIKKKKQRREKRRAEAEARRFREREERELKKALSMQDAPVSARPHALTPRSTATPSSTTPPMTTSMTSQGDKRRNIVRVSIMPPKPEGWQSSPPVTQQRKRPKLGDESSL